jgi:hypothetical protein
MVRIDPAALPAQKPRQGSGFVPPPATEHSTLGALRAWCEPKDEEDPPLGTICGVALDWQQAWWTLGQILAPMPDSTEVGLAGVYTGTTPCVSITGKGWDVLIAGLDPRSMEATTAAPVPLTPAKVLRMVQGGAA